LKLRDHDILLVTDVQNDFLPGGRLAVPNGEAIVPVINVLSRCFAHVALTQDWHAPGHLSFASSHPGRVPFEMIELPYGQQVLWPDHCVQGTAGAQFSPALTVPHAELIIRKGYRREIDSYSAFCEADGTTLIGLAGYLWERCFTRVFLVGLATDFAWPIRRRTLAVPDSRPSSSKTLAARSTLSALLPRHCHAWKRPELLALWRSRSRLI
jgi:nicotinamidase/pyrazinamidase